MKDSRAGHQGREIYNKYSQYAVTFLYTQRRAYQFFRYSLHLKKGSYVVFFSTFEGKGKEESRFARVKIYLRPHNKKKMMPTLKVLTLVPKYFEIPPGARHYQTSVETKLREDIQIVRFLSHAHQRATSVRVKLRTPDGKENSFCNVPYYTTEGASFHELIEPLWAPKGSEVIFTYTYDNSEQNPRNPNAKIAAKLDAASKMENAATKIYGYDPKVRLPFKCWDQPLGCPPSKDLPEDKNSVRNLGDYR